MATSMDLETLYVQRLQALERKITQQRQVLADHDNHQRDAHAWDEVRRKHDQRAAAIADPRRVLQQMMEELRFDVDVLVQDFRRFFAATDSDQPRPSDR